MFKPQEITVLSTEQKQLPFKSAKSFNVVNIEDFQTLGSELKKAIEDNGCKVIVIDSFTRILSMIKVYLEATNVTGYTFWKKYGEFIEKMILKSMITNKWVVWTAIADIFYNADGDEVREVGVQGKQLKGKIESYFTIALFTDVNQKATNLKDKYRFCTNSDGINASKTPMGLFDKQYIPNDLNLVFEKIAEYYEFEMDNFTHKRPNILIAGRSGTGKSTSLRNLIASTTKKEK